MQLKEIISTLMLSDFYFCLPLWERKEVVFRLWAMYGLKLPTKSSWPYPLTNHTQNIKSSPAKD